MDMLAALIAVLGICSSLALENDIKSSAPEDLDVDGSGDDWDYSGSGLGGVLVDPVPTDVKDVSSSVSPLASTVTQMSTVQQPDIAVKVETDVEDTTELVQITKLQDPIGNVSREQSTEGTTLVPTTLHTTAAEVVDLDAKKHHHHHTTTPSTTHPDSDTHDEATAVIPGAVDEHHIQPKEPTTSTPDEDSEMENVFQEVTTPADELIQPGVHHQATTSGSTSTPYADNEDVGVDTDEFPVLVNADVATTVADHRPPHEQPTSSFGGSNVHEEMTTKSTETEPNEDLFLQGVPNTTPSEENKHHHHHHHHHHHNHTTTPSATQSNDLEKYHIVHTKEPKGGHAHIPFAESTTAIPVMNPAEQLPEDVQLDDLSSSSTPRISVTTVQDEIEDSSDSKEEDGSGEDFFIEATVPLNRADVIPPSDDESSSNASHGIMERKELLAGIIAGGVAGLVFAAALVAFMLYRMKKKDEGSYSLEEPKQSNGGYQKPREQREFYA